MNTYRILEDNMDRLQKKLTRIRTKCNKYGCDFVYNEIGEEFNEVVDPTTGCKSIQKFIVVECEGTAKVNGWRFAATLEHHDNGNIVRKLIDAVEIPEKYYTCSPECEHCHARRHRKDTYIIYNEDTDEFKQVGSSCLCDYTHGFDAEAAAAYIALFDELIEGESPMSGGYTSNYYAIEDVVKYAADLVEHLGYRSSSYEGGQTTKEMVLDALHYDSGKISSLFADEVEKYRAKFNPDYNSEELIQYAQDAIQWVRDCEESNSYMHNLKVLVDDEYITYKNFGYAVSIVPTYNRHIQKQVELAERAKKHEAEVSSEYFGSVKDRITLTDENIKTIECVTSWYNDFGITLLYKIIDTEGHVFMWASSTGIRDDEDLEVTSITGTIKAHEEYKGVKQTWLTRCRVTYNKEV